MYTRQDVPQEVKLLARAQSGVVSRAQVLGMGLSRTVIRRLLADGIWGLLESGLYLVPNVEPNWHARVWAGVLLGGPDARVGGATAAYLQGLADSVSLPIDVLVPFGRKVSDRDWVSFRQERDGVRAVSTGSQPPRTRVEDTVLDLCAVGSEAAAISWVTAAVQRRLIRPEALSAAMGQRSRLTNRKLLHDLLTDVASGVHSSLERRYLHDIERAHGLPCADRQHRAGGRAVFVDVAYRRFGVLVELDGRIGHVEEGRLRDRSRDNAHATRMGLLTVRYGWHEVSEEPCAVALDVAELLVRGGWAGYPDKCGRCR